MADNNVNIYACRQATNNSRQFMNAQNSTETIVIPKFTNNPIDTVIKIRQVRARMIVCPAMILANRRIIRANGLVNTPKNSTKGMIGNGSFR